MSPINRRLPRELRHNIGKYLGLFFLLFLSISIASGFLVSARSIQRVVADTREAANLQDFSFTTQFEATDEALDDVRATGGGIDVVPDFYANLDISWEGKDGGAACTARVFGSRDVMDKVTYYAGRAPETASEVALDRNFMEENGLELGDAVTVAGHELTIVGQVVMPDYECMLRSSSDLMFDNQTFTVAQATPEGLEELGGDSLVYHYIARFHDRSLSLSERTEIEQGVAQGLSDDGARLSDLTDRESNTAITFVDDDLVSDSAGMEIMLYLLVLISAFVFVVLTDATIEQESSVIGTLLASGYRKGELVRHYLALPVLVGLAAAVAGNAVGYGLMVQPLADLYYHSYSLPTLHTYFDPRSFVETTVVPLALLVLITLVGVRRKLGATPLAFLRHEVGRGGQGSAVALPERWGFARRFRTRVFLRNLPHFVILFFGIVLSSILMLFGLGMLPLVHSAADQMASTVRAEHIYLLKAPLEIDVTEDVAQAVRDYEEREDAKAAKAAEGTGEEDGEAAQDGGSADGLEAGTGGAFGALRALASSGSGSSAAASGEAGGGSASDGTESDGSTASAGSAFNILSTAAGAGSGSGSGSSSGAGSSSGLGLSALLGAGSASGDGSGLGALASLLGGSDLTALASAEHMHAYNDRVNDADAVEQAEKFAAASLELEMPDGRAESLTVYGVEVGSAYWDDIDVSGGKIAVGRGLVEKYGLELGHTMTIRDKYTDTDYVVAPVELVGNATDTNVYMSRAEFCELFDGLTEGDPDYFNGYASDEPLDLNGLYLASEVTPDDMRAMANQMDSSMGQVMGMMLWLAIPISIVLIYLLTKTVIDRSARSISYMKVFGYREKEIDRLYLRPVTWVVVCSYVLSIPLVTWLVSLLMDAYLSSYSGHIEVSFSAGTVCETVAIGVATYLVVAAIHMAKVRRVPLALALKAQE